MRKVIGTTLLCAGVLLSLAGCQKGSDVKTEGHAVQFGVASGAVATRTAYGDDVEEGGTKYQRIDWQSSDRIFIWSNLAVVRTEGDNSANHSATYGVSDFSQSGRKSNARLTDIDGKGLVYQDAAESGYKFWGMYPAGALDAAAKTALNATPTTPVAFAIPAEQTPAGSTATDGNTVQNPDMSKAVMFALSQEVAKDAMVNMLFYPAFTAYEFELKNGQETGNIDLKDITLSSTSKVLAGDVVATLSTPDQPAVLALKTAGEGEEVAASHSVKYTFNNGSNVAIAPGKSLRFTVFTTGVENVNDLTATFTYGSGIERTVSFKKNGTPVTFDACKKHRLLGIAMREDWYFAELNLEGEPINWFDSNPETDNKDYPEATQFNVTGAYNYYWDPDNEDWAQYEKWRQYWLMGPNDIATVTFKVLSPVGYYWLVEVVDPDNAFVVTGNGTAEDAVNGLKGLINNKKTIGEGEDAVEISTTTNVVLTIKAADSEDTDEHQLYLRTYAVSADGSTKYSLDSETQTNDLVTNPAIGPRGYHYFILNNSTIVTTD